MGSEMCIRDRYYLLVGPPNSERKDLSLCHVVEIKQQRTSSPLYHFPNVSPINRLNPAHLTCKCQRYILRGPDLLLDEVYWRDSHWLVRSRYHARVGLDPEDISLAARKPGRALRQYAEACGESLAIAHNLSDRRSIRFESSMIKALESKAADELVDTAQEYSLLTIADQKLLSQSIDSVL